MDNITHTLISALIGEGAARALPAPKHGLSPQTRRNLFVVMMAVGGNLPDLDFFYSLVTGGKLDYLLHHRGHTHTVLGALATAAVLLIAADVVLRWKRRRPSASDRIALLCVALFAPLLHLAMDLSNNYGVHPFWPFYNGWLYGDSVFIIEPLLWAACAPLACLLHTRLARGLVLLILAAGVALTLFSGLAPVGSAIAFVMIAAALLALGAYAAPRIALACGLIVWLGATAAFVASGRIAGERSAALAAVNFPEATLLDQVLTPMPVNPLCWEVMLVQKVDDDLILRRAMLSLAPARLPAQQCLSRRLEALITAPVQPVAARSDRALQWYGEVTSSIAQLRELVASDCRAAAFMQFARAPWLAVVDDALVIGDLRYDREPTLGFAEIDLRERGACPRGAPPWSPPRAELLPSQSGSFPTPSAFLGARDAHGRAM